MRKPSLLASTASISFFTGLARIAGAGKTALITLFFRPGQGLDTYLLAFLIPSFLADVFCGALNPVLVPVMVPAMAASRESAMQAGTARGDFSDLYAVALYRTTLAASALAALVAAGVFAMDSLGWPTRTGNGALFHQMLLILIPILPLSAVGNVWRSVLHAEMRFGTASFSHLLTPVIASLFLAAAHSWGIVVLAAGSAAGMAGEVAFLGAALRHAGIPLLPARRANANTFLPVQKQYWALVAVHLVTKGAYVVDQTVAAMYGAGGLSVFNLSTRVSGVVVAVGPEALGTALLPRFSQLLATSSGRDARRSLIRSLAGAVSLMTLVAGALIWFSEPIVRLAFSHGALTRQDVLQVAAAQRWAMVQIPFSVGLAIAARFVASMKANQAILPIWAAALAAHALLDYVAMKRFGVPGIIGVSAVVEALVLAAVLVTVFRRLPKQALK